MLPQVVRMRNPGLNHMLDMLGSEQNSATPQTGEKQGPWWRQSCARKQQSGGVSVARYVMVNALKHGLLSIPLRICCTLGE